MKTPAVVLCNPKYPHNIGTSLRACSCYSINSLLWTGNRVIFDKENGERIPREERMKGYKNVEWLRTDKPFDLLQSADQVVGIELAKGAMNLLDIEHSENMVYVFGPEDGSIPKVLKSFCHFFAYIPTHHCLNLSTAVATVLYDRRKQRTERGLEPKLIMTEMLHESRGPTPALDAIGWDGK